LVSYFSTICIFKCIKKKFLQGDFENCADILSSDRTPQKVTIDPLMPFTNVDISQGKRIKSKKKTIVEFFVVI
jgi:hypothetical protein